MSALDEFRAEKDEFFVTSLESPLTSRQKRSFSGLAYFPEDPGMVFEVQVARAVPASRVEIQTSTGDIQVYERYGKLPLTLDGQPVELTVYADPDGGFFLPFVDSLAGVETYPAGRYLEPSPLGDDRFLVDFNLAYNPYCAYNDGWSCPLTPPENRLKVPIRAGEKLFHRP